MTPNIYVSSVWNLQHATLLASRILRYLLGFRKFVHPCIERNFSTSWTDSYRKLFLRTICPKHAKPRGPNIYVSSLLLHILPSLLPFQIPSRYFTSAILFFTLLYNLRQICSDTEPDKLKATALINIHKTHIIKLNPMYTSHSVTSLHHGTNCLL